MKQAFLPSLFLLTTLLSCSKKDQAPPPSGEKSITYFGFKVSRNPGLLQDVEGIIEGDTIYAPTFAGTSATLLKPYFAIKGASLTVSGVRQTADSSQQDYKTPVTYTVTAEDGSTKNYIVKLDDTGLPAIYISTNNVPITSKETYIDGSMWIAGSVAGDTVYSGALQIRGRGNSTWGFPKKPYKIKLNKKFPLLGMSSDKNWALLASYGDKSLIRDEVAFELSRRLGLAYTPSGRFADVILNGEYVGNYQLVETIDVASKKVNIDEQAVGTTALPDLSGGYLLEIDGYAYQEPVNFLTPYNMPVTVHYPKDDEITPQQKSYIQNHYSLFENALFGSSFTDSVNGYQKYLDLSSYVNYYLVNEIIENSDLFWSTYQYKKRNDDKLYTGPVWDFDLAANDDSRLGDAVKLLMLDAGHNPRQWISRMMEDSAFRHAVRNRWNAVKGNVGTINDYIDLLAHQLARSQKANFKRWDVLNTVVHLELQTAGSFDGEIAYLKQFLTTRIPWLDTQFNSARFD